MGLARSAPAAPILLDREEELVRGNTTKDLFLASGKVSLYQGLGLLLAFCLQAFLSRSSGAAALGGFTLFVAWLTILSALTIPGLESTLVYFLPRYGADPESRRRVVFVSLLITGAVSTMAAGVILSAGGRGLVWIGLPAGARIAFAFSVIVFSIGKLLDAVFLGMGDAQLIGFFNGMRTLLRLLFCLPVLFYPKATGPILFGAILCEGTLTAILRYRKMRSRYPELRRLGQAESPGAVLQRRAIVANALPMCGINVIDTVSPFLDKAILGVIGSLDMVGIYRVSESLASLNTLFVAPFIAFWPHISRLFGAGRLEELREAYRNVNLLIIALMIPFSLVLVEMSDFALSLFGKGFAHQGRAVLLILAFGSAVDAIAGPAGAVLRMTSHSRVSLAINLFLLVLYAGLGVLLTRRYGLVGAALARTTMLVMGNAANLVANYLLLRIFPYTLKHASLLGCGVAILAARYLCLGSNCTTEAHSVIAMAEAAAFAGCAALILREQTRQAIKLMRNALAA